MKRVFDEATKKVMENKLEQQLREKEEENMLNGMWKNHKPDTIELPYSKRNTIIKAASLLKGQRLNDLYYICEHQKTISTKKLEKYLDKIHDGMRLDAIHFRNLADKIS